MFGSTAYYYAGTLDGSRPGVYYVNLNNLRNQYDIVTTNVINILCMSSVIIRAATD